jgi:hypothetical protein
MTFIKPFIRGAKILFTPLAIIFLGYFAWQSKTQLLAIFYDAQINWLLLSISLWALLHCFSPIFTVVILSSHSLSIHYKTALFIHTSRLPAKYLPGGIWHTVARAADYQRHGMTTRHIGYYLLLENILAAAVSLALGGAIIINFLLTNSSAWSIVVVGLTIFCTATLIILPYFFNKYILLTETKLTAQAYFQGVCCTIIYWTIASVAFVCFLLAFPDIVLTMPLIEAAGAYIFSWGIGFISIFAPQGIGVSEFVSSQLLMTHTATTSLVVFLAGFRVIIFISDLMVWLLTRLIFGKVTPRSNSRSDELLPLEKTDS